ncbi:MAG: divergent PAP2 family protein [Clostridiales bacterium]|nr:divergent PAP2 family protein [Clostridiales bacterium]
MNNFTADNQILITVIAAWASAQLLKTLITLWIERRFVPERLLGPGGMPSSHSSTVCSLAVSTAIIYSIHSFEFCISLVLAMIVMHDAMNVRLETGKQAKILNEMMKNNPLHIKGEVFEEQLKELVGHTPTQVICGALLGVAVALIVNYIAA